MALIVEDGSGMDDADSYISLADADAYHTAHGSPAAWTAATDATKESALRMATVWLDAHFRWIGVIFDGDQALGWPRSGAVDRERRVLSSDIVPTRVAEACAHLALYHLSAALDAALERGDMVQSVTVGPVSIVYADGAPPGTSMPYIRAMLSGISRGGANQVVMERA